MRPTHIHIVGHGLAGAILAETLSRAGLVVTVTDDGKPSSSRVAAGLFTPLTGRRMIPSWRLEEALPVLHSFYPALEKELGISCFHPLSTVRILRDDAQHREFNQNRNSPYVGELRDQTDLPFRTPCGTFEMRGGGWVNLPVLLDALEKRRKLRGEWGEPSQDPDRTVWAQGAAAAEDPLWREVGWRNAHGDILTVHIPTLPQDRIYNFGRFLLPIGNGHFRCGATYAWNQDSASPRPGGRKELEQELHAWLTCRFEVVDHQAGIRPVALARVPVAGPHPDQPRQWIFNGFASKGVLYAPWMARQLVDHWLHGTGLPRDVRADRRIHRQRAREQTRKGQGAS